MRNLASFLKPEACGQTVLPDRSVLIDQKLVENDKMQKFKCDILGDFQTLWKDLRTVIVVGNDTFLKEVLCVTKLMQNSVLHLLAL